MATGNAEPDHTFRLLPGLSAVDLSRAAIVAVVGGTAVVFVSVGAIVISNSVGSPLPSGLVAVPLVAVGVSLLGRVLGFAAGRRADREAEAGYTTIAGRPNLPRRDPRTGAVLSAEPIPGPDAVQLNAVSTGTTVLDGSAKSSGAPHPEGARFRRRIPLLVTIVGALVIFGFALGIPFLTSGRRVGDLGPALSPVLGVGIPILVVLAFFLVFYGVSGASEVHKISTMLRGAVVFCSTATVDGADAFSLLGASGPAPRYRFTVAMDRHGLELHRMGEVDPFVRIPWSSVVSVEPGTAAIHGGTASRAIILGVRIGESVPLRVPFPVIDPRIPWMLPLGAANDRLDQMRVLWGESQRAARNQRAASGGRVSSTEAARPFQGSSEAVTEP
jgi:hypothetical protein